MAELLDLGYESLEFVKLEETTEALNWKPGEPGDYIIGKYLKTEEGKGRGEGLIFHHLQDTHKQEVSILGSTVLNKKMERIAPETVIKIEYLGKAANQNGRKYNNFEIYIAPETIKND